MNSDPDRELEESVEYLRRRIHSSPRIAVILGSGLGGYADGLPERVAVPTSEIPHYPSLTVQGHKGALVAATVAGKAILAFQGRMHYYESGSLRTILFPIHIAHRLGITTLIVTNASGAVNRDFEPGDLMAIEDHINLTFESAAGDDGRQGLAGYRKELLETLDRAATNERIPIRRGVYVGVKGPSYETAAEVEMIRRVGGDAVGMSTVLEVTLASSLGMGVLGITCITNKAAGISGERLNHAEVTVVANRVKENFARLITATIALL